ncbi:MAG: hypothetical protein IJX87_00105 [Clostridia bacterium]|nr:hypothetical protein [Clostridia bacterium]
MKRKYILILIILGIVCLLLPLAIEFIYDIGETHPIYYTRYSASDVLSYIATVIGLMLSVIAIMLSLQSNELQIKIKHSHTVTKDNKEGIYYEIINDSLFDCKIISFELANKKGKHHCKIFWKPPFNVKAKNSYYAIVDIESVKKHYESVAKSNPKGKVYYYIRTSTNHNLYLSVDGLLRCFKESEKQQKLLEKIRENE